MLYKKRILMTGINDCVGVTRTTDSLFVGPEANEINESLDDVIMKL